MNLLGIVLGLLTVRIFSNKKYNWIYPGKEHHVVEGDGVGTSSSDNDTSLSASDAEDDQQPHADRCTQSLSRVPSKHTLQQVAQQFTPRQVRACVCCCCGGCCCCCCCCCCQQGF